MRAYRKSFNSEDGSRGLTQEGLLRRMASVDDDYGERFSHTTVSRWESGATRPSVGRLRVFGRALGLSPTEVAGLILLAGLAPDFHSALDKVDRGGDEKGARFAHRPGPNERSIEFVRGVEPAEIVPLILRDIFRFVFLRCLPLAICITLAGYALSFLGWENMWMPALYVGFATGLVLAQGFLIPDREAKLREFFWVTLFFLLSTPLLQFAPVRMDHYNFYAVGGFADTHLPYVLALLTNLALASSAGLMFQLLWKWRHHRHPDRSSVLRRALWAIAPPVAFVYVVIVLISNASVWIQLAVLLPVVAAVFTALLVLHDPSTSLKERERHFLLTAIVTGAVISTTLGLATAIAIYVSPDLPRVLPDHNLLRSWEINFAELGYTRQEALERLNIGYMWHAMFTLGYMLFVVGGSLIVTIYCKGGGETPRSGVTRSESSAPLSTSASKRRVSPPARA